MLSETIRIQHTQTKEPPSIYIYNKLIKLQSIKSDAKQQHTEIVEGSITCGYCSKFSTVCKGERVLSCRSLGGWGQGLEVGERLGREWVAKDLTEQAAELLV